MSTSAEQTTTRPGPARSGNRHVGPPLLAPALTFTVLFVASLILGPVLGSGAIPSPFGDPGAVLSYFQHSATASQVTGFLQFDAAISLGVFTAVAVARMRFLSPNVPGPIISGVGGVLASVFLALNGLLQWVLGQPGMTEQPVLVRALDYLFFLCGGPAHVVTLGLLIAGIAVTALFNGALPRWLGFAGVVIAALAVLSVLTMVVPAVAILLPIARFTGMIWIVATAALLPRARNLRRPTESAA